MHPLDSLTSAAVAIATEIGPVLPALETARERGCWALLSQQTPDGYWWYTLEANESIGAEYIFLEHFLDRRTPGRWERLAERMLAEQLPDGSWALAFGQPGDLSTTLECYVALRMAGHESTHPALQRAKAFIAAGGGLAAARVFTQIHFACLGIVSWALPPSMPVEIMLLPSWAPFSVYSFSSWARACIIPLLIIMTEQPVWPLPCDLADELPPGDARAAKKSRRDIWAELFRWVDRIMKVTHPFTKRRPTKKMALQRAEDWVRAHVEKTEDIFPALSYGALSLAALGYSENDPIVAKALAGLHRFQHGYEGPLAPLPFHPRTNNYRYAEARTDDACAQVHQQCCISPLWDTPWAMCALQAAGTPPNHPALMNGARWLLKQQITNFYGDWYKKNPHGKPGGWAFEFENPHFPDIDDTIQVLLAIHGTALPHGEAAKATALALEWCLSMQNDDGGWAAFDKNNSLAIVNKIPFADHGACLDPSSPDITGRMLQILARYGYTLSDAPVARALAYLRRTQETDGSWFGRWGVNYVYGTWAVLTGLQDIGYDMSASEVQHALSWLESIQNADGGFGESVDSYPRMTFVAGPSTASQTAWGLMGLIAGNRLRSDAAGRAACYLVHRQREDGAWSEPQYTGTGFPGHFYIRYHGYRHYFPLLALGRYHQALQEQP